MFCAFRTFNKRNLVVDFVNSFKDHGHVLINISDTNNINLYGHEAKEKIVVWFYTTDKDYISY